MKKIRDYALAKRKSKHNDITRRSLHGIPYVQEYKYLGLVLNYTMNIGSSIQSTSKLVSNMLNYKILGYNKLSVNQKLSLWKLTSSLK